MSPLVEVAAAEGVLATEVAERGGSISTSAVFSVSGLLRLRLGPELLPLSARSRLAATRLS